MVAMKAARLLALVTSEAALSLSLRDAFPVMTNLLQAGQGFHHDLTRSSWGDPDRERGCVHAAAKAPGSPCGRRRAGHLNARAARPVRGQGSGLGGRGGFAPA
jgi:hypothetical protein